MSWSHVTTDPACMVYRAPRTAWGRWRHNRARGKVCVFCMHARAIAKAVLGREA